jgi:hypothetical protein
MSVAGGAAAGLAVGKFARGIGTVPGMIGGAALGLSASALLKKDDKAAAPDDDMILAPGPLPGIGEPTGAESQLQTA